MNAHVPPIVSIEHNEEARNVTLVDAAGRTIEFENLTYFEASAGRVVLDWENSGPSGPWTRSVRAGCTYNESGREARQEAELKQLHTRVAELETTLAKVKGDLEELIYKTGHADEFTAG